MNAVPGGDDDENWAVAAVLPEVFGQSDTARVHPLHALHQEDDRVLLRHGPQELGEIVEGASLDLARLVEDAAQVGAVAEVKSRRGGR
jgi:hypothetical protein